MDPAQSREQLRKILRTCGADLTLFGDPELDILWEACYRSGRALEHATRLGLTASGLPPGLIDHILTLQGAAVGPGPGNLAAAGLPPVRKLRLRQDSQEEDLFFFEPADTADTAANTAAAAAAAATAASAATITAPGVRAAGFFLDPGGRLTLELQDWLRLVKEYHVEGAPIAPLIINGLVKSGKSFTLNEVLPAVARTYYGSGGGGGGGQQHAAAAAVLPEPNFLHVDCSGCERGSGAGAFLADFLLQLTRSAAAQQLSAAASAPVPNGVGSTASVMRHAIQDFMLRLPRDRLNFLLVDEAQCFYLLERPVPPPPVADTRAQQQRDPAAAVLDGMAMTSMRIALKLLLLESPPWVAWAVTGSAMATVWANVAETPTNGFALIMHHRRLNLSPTVPTDVLRAAWQQLKIQTATWSPPPPDDLVWRSPPHHAMLAYLCQEWRLHSCTAGTAELLVEQTMAQKLIPELLADLRVVLEALGQPDKPDAQYVQLRLLHKLLDPLAGVEPATLPPAFTALLAAYSTKRYSRLYLDCPLFAQMLRAIISRSGLLLDPGAPIQWTSCSSRLRRELTALGEACNHPTDFDGCEDLRRLLGDMAAALQLPPDDLLKAEWFVRVLDHRYNCISGTDIFVREHEAQARQDATVGLRWFHALQRNVLDHGCTVERQQVLDAYPQTLREFVSSGRVSEVLTKTHNRPLLPSSRGMPSSSTPRAQTQAQAQVQPHAGPPPLRPAVSLCWGTRLLGRSAAAVQPRYMGRMGWM
ncbi:hypothetical protein HXX76_016082 [Chlamydomonas incerta]|uniref:Uncharacterized protein n=1 Tax=Chlamydomonas incerta TaxID=51695 RepID=A0A835SCU7_CHLIN|nr:hypothetical protein HXX76_016082 [Chlamydomonas incerta]|eukprot:KAG2422357.1 hypothetical protein HXX76_016082 [Chlamydomonas incerta]